MSATQTFDPELVEALKEVPDMLEDVAKKLPQSIAQVNEYAKSAGVAALEKDTEEASSAADALAKVFKEISECVQEYMKIANRVQDALG